MDLSRLTVAKAFSMSKKANFIRKYGLILIPARWTVFQPSVLSQDQSAASDRSLLCMGLQKNKDAIIKMTCRKSRIAQHGKVYQPENSLWQLHFY
jgi:hypothetical protein